MYWEAASQWPRIHNSHTFVFLWTRKRSEMDRLPQGFKGNSWYAITWFTIEIRLIPFCTTFSGQEEFFITEQTYLFKFFSCLLPILIINNNFNWVEFITKTLFSSLNSKRKILFLLLLRYGQTSETLFKSRYGHVK